MAIMIDSSGTKYGLVTFTRRFAFWITAANSLRLLSFSKLGPLGTTWASQSPGWSASTTALGRQRELTGLADPVGEEHSVELADDRPLEAGDQLAPVQAAGDVLLQVVVVDDQVLRAGVGDQPVDHNDLAVVAHVNPTQLALKGLDRQHRVVLRTHVRQHLDGFLAVGVGKLGHVVRQHPDGHPAREPAAARRTRAGWCRRGPG